MAKKKKGVRKTVSDVSSKLADHKALAAGAMGVAAAGLFAVRRARSNGAVSAFHVLPDGEGWCLREEDANTTLDVFPRKRDAVRAGRELAGEQRPSCLVIHRSDGRVSRTHTYPAQ